MYALGFEFGLVLQASGTSTFLIPFWALGCIYLFSKQVGK